MERNTLSRLFSSVQKEIALLKKEVEKSELRKNNLKKQTLIHIAAAFPEEYRRIVGKGCYIEIGNKFIENTFLDLNLAQKWILGCSLKVKSLTIESSEENLRKNWILEGQLSPLSFIIEYTATEISSPESKEELIEVEKLDIFPLSEVLESLSTSIIASYSLKTLISSLYMFQKIQDERAKVEETLSSLIEVETSEENNVLTILVNLDSQKLKIEWSFLYNSRGNRFIHNIMVFAEDEMKNNYSGTDVAPILSGEELLTSADEVMTFIGALC